MVTAALLFLLPVWLPGAPAQAQELDNQAGLVIVHSDGRVITRCVAFDEPQISGFALLERAGMAFEVQAGPLGASVCTLNGEGCPSSNCFCSCTGLPCLYWNYYHRTADGSWAYSGVGATLWQVSNGDVDAWLWGESSQLPPAVSFDEICGAPSQVDPMPPATLVPDTTAGPTMTVTSPPSTVATQPAPTPTSPEGDAGAATSRGRL
mgnify:FL=1